MILAVRILQMRSWFGLAILALVALAVWLRTDSTRILSRDESSSWRMTQYSATELVQRLGQNVHPPLHYLILQTWSEWFGNSALALRGLSLLLSLMTGVIVAYTSHVALKLGTSHPASDESGGQVQHCSLSRWPVLFPASFLAAHVLSVEAGSTARMYGLGMFLAALSAFFLLRALQAESWSSSWWLTYGVTIAAYCYTHYFAFFTIVAQACFVVGASLVQYRQFPRNISTLVGWSVAVFIAALLFLPWASVFLGQLSAVQQNWWVSQMTHQDVEHSFCLWLTGVEYPVSSEARLWLACLGALACWTLVRAGCTAWFYFLQAVVPWICAVAYSTLGGQPILLDRCMVFALVGAAGFWGVTLQTIQRLSIKFCVFVFLMSPCIFGAIADLMKSPADPATFEQAANWLEQQHATQDVYLIDDFRDVNRLRYYTQRAGLPWIDIKAPVQVFHKGHRVHIATLTIEEAQENWDVANSIRPRRRLWLVRSDDPNGKVLESRIETRRKTFSGDNGPTLTLSLQELAQ